MYEEAQLRVWMRMAIDLGKKSVTGGDAKVPHVGVVIVKEGIVIGSGYRGMKNPDHHAEFAVLQNISAPDTVEGATVFSTLEPCSKRGRTKTPCARRLADARVGEVHIGIFDTNPVIYREGWKILTAAGITVRDFPIDMRDEIAVDNAAFLARYKTASGDAGQVRFDHRVNGGKFTVETSVGDFVITTDASGFIYDYENNVALAHHATEFSQIDDPSALDFGIYHRMVGVGQIACLRSANGYLLIKRVVTEPSGPAVRDFEFEARGSIE